MSFFLPEVRKVRTAPFSRRNKTSPRWPGRKKTCPVSTVSTRLSLSRDSRHEGGSCLNKSEAKSEAASTKVDCCSIPVSESEYHTPVGNKSRNNTVRYTTAFA